MDSWGCLLVSTSGEMAPYLSITLKHTSKGKDLPGLLVCLLCSLLDFPKGFQYCVTLALDLLKRSSGTDDLFL